jgi:carboxymethylenebutenolidase
MATSPTEGPAEGPSGTGYLVLPDSGSGPGVLVLHSWWGLNDFFRGVCDRLADAGFVALAPDLVGGGRTTDDPEVAERWLAESDTNVTADLVLSSAAILRNLAQTPAGPIGVCGWSMGASWALWLASRAPEQVGALSFFYGVQQVDRLDVRAPSQGHFAEHDDLVDVDDRVVVEAALHLGNHPVDVHHYPGTNHWFFEAGPTHDPVAASLAWDRTLAFLHEHLDGDLSGDR